MAPRLGDDRGSVVAEFAVALPAVVLVLAVGVGALAAASRQVRLQDAVADAARLSARGESAQRVRDAVAATVAVACAWAAIAPSGQVLRTIDVALVQGGGPQRTRADITENPIVLQRHLDATKLIEGEVDLVVWPENVVNPEQVPDNGVLREPDLLYEDDARTIVERVCRW